MVATQSWCGVEVLDVRRPTRTAGREELPVVAQIAISSYEGALGASGTVGVMTRLFYTTEEEKTLILSHWMEPCGKRSGWQIVLVVW